VSGTRSRVKKREGVISVARKRDGGRPRDIRREGSERKRGAVYMGPLGLGCENKLGRGLDDAVPLRVWILESYVKEKEVHESKRTCSAWHADAANVTADGN